MLPFATSQNIPGRDDDLRRDSHEVTEEGRWDLSQLKHFYRRLHAHVDEQDVQHSAAVKVGDLKPKTLFRQRFEKVNEICRTLFPTSTRDHLPL